MREDLATVSRSNVYEYAIIKKALKVSRRRRITATMPRIPELDCLLAELETRSRATGVETLLVNSFGAALDRGRSGRELQPRPRRGRDFPRRP